jgi:hypothetical protein
MTIISREEAVCLFYAVPYNQENINKYTSIINQIEDVDICFTRNPHKPRLLCTKVIYANAFDIHLYKSQTDQETNNPYTKFTLIIVYILNLQVLVRKLRLIKVELRVDIILILLKTAWLKWISTIYSKGIF